MAKHRYYIDPNKVYSYPEEVSVVRHAGKILVIAFGMTFIEAMNADVLTTVYGDNNVTGSSVESGLSIKANSKDLSEYVFVVDMVLKGDVIKRIVIPKGKVTEVGEISYTDSDAVGYEVTISATPDTDGNTHYEYIKKSSTTL